MHFDISFGKKTTRLISRTHGASEKKPKAACFYGNMKRVANLWKMLEIENAAKTWHSAESS